MLAHIGREKIKKTLQGQIFSATTDHWTSCRGHTYATLTVQYIEDFQVQNWVLAVYQFHGSTAHEQIVKDFKSQLEKWDISMENVPFLVTDTAAAMNLAGIVLQTATEDLIEHVYCLDHVIQLTAKLAFNAKVKGQALETIEESDIGSDDEDEDEGAAGS
jgi:hypothetical protein